MNQTLDRYEILSVLGEGAFGIVYKAKHTLMGRTVAIKVLNEESPDAMLMRRFHVEAQAASTLTHPNIVTVYDFGSSTDNQLYLVMDYVDGIDLDQVLKTEGRLAVKRALNIFIQCCEALEHAHDRGVIHRDLKPSNIMLIRTKESNEFVKIVDFGLAKIAVANSERLTQTGDLLGTPLYMSPEQCLGEPLDARSDIYALGCIMYRVLTDCLPIEGKNILATLYGQISAAPAPFQSTASGLDIPDRLQKIVLKSLQKDPAARYQSMSEVEQELRLVLAEMDGKPAKVTAAKQSSPQRKKLLVAALALVGLSFCFSSPTPHTPNKLPVEKKQTVEVAKQQPVTSQKPRTESRPTQRRLRKPKLKTTPASSPPTTPTPVIVTPPTNTTGPETAVEPVQETKYGRFKQAVSQIASEYLTKQDEQPTTTTGRGRKLGKYKKLLQEFVPRSQELYGQE